LENEQRAWNFAQKPLKKPKIKIRRAFLRSILVRREGKLYLEFWANVLKKAIEDLYLN